MKQSKLSIRTDGDLWTAQWWTEGDTPGGAGEILACLTIDILAMSGACCMVQFSRNWQNLCQKGLGHNLCG